MDASLFWGCSLANPQGAVTGSHETVRVVKAITLVPLSQYWSQGKNWRNQMNLLTFWYSWCIQTKQVASASKAQSLERSKCISNFEGWNLSHFGQIGSGYWSGLPNWLTSSCTFQCIPGKRFVSEPPHFCRINASILMKFNAIRVLSGYVVVESC